MRKLVAAVAFVMLVCAGGGCPSDSGNGNGNKDATVYHEAAVEPDADLSRFDWPAQVVRIVDGDTIMVRIQGTEVRVRFIGVDTPELTTNPPEAFAEEARDFTAYYAPEDSWIGLEFDDPACEAVPAPSQCLDPYDRLLAYIRLYEGGDLGGMLLSNGLARVYTASNYSRQTEYLNLEAEARAAGLGIWQ